MKPRLKMSKSFDTFWSATEIFSQRINPYMSVLVLTVLAACSLQRAACSLADLQQLEARRCTYIHITVTNHISFSVGRDALLALSASDA